MKIVIIGGVAAGAKVAAKARRLIPDAEIKIFTQDTHVSYSSCGLPYYIEGNFEDWRKLLVRSVEEFEKSGISINLKKKVIKLIPSEKKILVKCLDTEKDFFEDYDKLVIATGARPNVPPIKNVNLDGIFTLKTLEDGINIRNAMSTAKNITLVGAGYINIELLEAFLKNGKNVTIIEKAPFILPLLDEEVSELVKNYILENFADKCRIIVQDSVSEFIPKSNRVGGVLTENGVGFETDMVIIGAGVLPNVEFAQEAGINIGTTGAILVNSRMETNIEDIYACGDCVEKLHLVSNTPCYIPLGSTSNKEGRVAAVNLSGIVEDFEGVLGSIATRFYNLRISMTGLTEKQARKLNYDVVSVMITKKDKAGYMPEVQNITLKLVADRRSHRLLGAQAIGCGEADKKINTISLGLQERITIEKLIDVDLTYAPPFSTSIDILHSAARILKSKIG